MSCSAFILLIVVIIGARLIIIRVIHKHDEILSDIQRRWISAVQNSRLVLMFFGLILIWGAEIQKLALSLTAFTVALVIASKELILCLPGSFLRVCANSFSVGDWIEIAGMRGEVIEQSLLATTMHELEVTRTNYGFTGKTIVLPNSLFLTHAVKHHNFLKNYVYHSFNIITEPKVSPFAAKTYILGRIQEYTQSFVTVAERDNRLIERRMQFDLPSIEPWLRISTTDFSKNVVTIVLFCPVAEAVNLEQRITEDYLDWVYRETKSATDKSATDKT